MILELTPEQRAFKEQIEQFATEIVAPRAALIDKTGEYPSDVVHAAASAGLCGVTLPKAWGGLGRDYVSYALAVEAIAKASATVAVALTVRCSATSIRDSAWRCGPCRADASPSPRRRSASARRR